MKIIELIIDETDEQSGIEAISLVEQPAIESNFVALNKQEVLLKEIDSDKRILMGPALIPDKSIYRLFVLKYFSFAVSSLLPSYRTFFFFPSLVIIILYNISLFFNKKYL